MKIGACLLFVIVWEKLLKLGTNTEETCLSLILCTVNDCSISGYMIVYNAQLAPSKGLTAIRGASKKKKDKALMCRKWWNAHADLPILELEKHNSGSHKILKFGENTKICGVIQYADSSLQICSLCSVWILRRGTLLYRRSNNILHCRQAEMLVKFIVKYSRDSCQRFCCHHTVVLSVDVNAVRVGPHNRESKILDHKISVRNYICFFFSLTLP